MNKIKVRQIKEPDFLEGFSIRDIGTLLSERDMVQGVHKHNFFFVLFLEKGKGEHIIDFINYPVDDYSVFFMRPGQIHQLILKQGSKGYLIQFNREFYTPKEGQVNFVLRKVSNKNHCPLSAERFKKIHSQLSFIFEEYTQKKDRYKESIIAYLDILFIEMARQSPNPHTLSNESKLYAQERLEELQDLIEKNIYTKKKVSDYADMLSITPYQLNSITTSTLQKIASEIINDHLILEAKRLLIATTNQVNQVADLLGYEDPSYFIRFFKKQTGITPETFRQNFK